MTDFGFGFVEFQVPVKVLSEELVELKNLEHNEDP